MFNRTVVVAPTQRITEQVIINRAPTDESVALLKEMEDAARKKVEDSIRLNNIHMECLVHSNYDAVNDAVLLEIKLKINGVLMQIDHTHRRHESLDELGDVLIKKISEAIAHNILRDITRQLVSLNTFKRLVR